MSKQKHYQIMLHPHGGFSAVASRSKGALIEVNPQEEAFISVAVASRFVKRKGIVHVHPECHEADIALLGKEETLKRLALEGDEGPLGDQLLSVALEYLERNHPNDLRPYDSILSVDSENITIARSLWLIEDHLIQKATIATDKLFKV